MGNPHDRELVVPAGTGTLYYNGKPYGEGAVIPVPSQTHLVCQKTQMLPELHDECFPSYSAGPDGHPTEGYRVPVIIPAGSTVVHEVPTIEGCKYPAMVCFDYCAACLYVGYDADPIIDPSDPEAALGGGADPNPTCRALTKGSSCIETIHIMNPTDADVTAILSYYKKG